MKCERETHVPKSIEIDIFPSSDNGGLNPTFEDGMTEMACGLYMVDLEPVLPG